MDTHLTAILDALHGVKLLPRRPPEQNIVYGYVHADRLIAVVGQVSAALGRQGYEVHQCSWGDEAVLLALDGSKDPLALRFTSSSSERYNMYALSRPLHAQALWQWAQAMLRNHLRQQREQEA